MAKKLVVNKANGEAIYCKTINQEKLIDLIEKNDITFVSGSAGTGKTFLAVAKGLNYLKSGTYTKIIIARPLVESGEKLGSLPGDVMDKITPYIKPIQDFIKEILGNEDKKLKPTRARKKNEKDNGNMNLFNQIEIAPLAYLRGSTFSNAYVILDEAQNTTCLQMKMFLTRIGENSKLIITGDDRQVDLPYHVKSGLIDAIDRLEGVKGIGHIEMGENDIVRHGIIRDIIRAYETERVN